MTDYKKFNEIKLSPFQARYGESIPDNHYPVNEFVENILKRQSIRRFKNKQLDPKLLEKLIAAAQSSPTSSMIQPWSILALESSAQKAKLFSKEHEDSLGLYPTSKLHGQPSDWRNLRAIMGCSVFLIWLVDATILEKIFTDTSLNQTHPELAELRIESLQAIRHTHFELRCLIDTVIAAQTFCLAAESLGLGTMYCGAIRTMDLKETYNLPDRVLPIFGLCVGYPADDLSVTVEPDISQNKYVKPRLPQSLILHKEVYQEHDFEEIKRYNKLLELYYQTQNLTHDWFDRVVRRTQLWNSNRFYRKLLEKCGFKLW